ncbi:phosphoribosylamine--glycine ligase [Trifolium repens]|nr:phosphoribosylamine--glycine ligase [Trifolium repens]
MADPGDQSSDTPLNSPLQAARITCTKSDSNRTIKTWHSGSPNRTLYLINLSMPDFFSIISSACKTPTSLQPSADIPFTVGMIIESITID